MVNKLRGVHHTKKVYESTIPINTSEELSTTPKSRALPLVVLLILVLGGSLYYYLQVSYPFLFKTITSKITSLSDQSTPSPTPDTRNVPVLTPAPMPYSLPKGSQSYSFNHGSDVRGPKPTSVIIDPLDPANGAIQTLTLELVSDSAVTSTALTITTDNNQKELTFTRTKGDDLKGTYVASWQVEDSYDVKYSFRYVLKSQTGTFDNTMYMRR